MDTAPPGAAAEVKLLSKEHLFEELSKEVATLDEEAAAATAAAFIMRWCWAGHELVMSIWGEDPVRLERPAPTLTLERPAPPLAAAAAVGTVKSRMSWNRTTYALLQQAL